MGGHLPPNLSPLALTASVGRAREGNELPFFDSELIKRGIRKGGALIFGRKPRIHRIPFGPLRGKRIFLSFDISPRMYFGIDEPWVAQLARRHVTPGGIVYDIGAHVGYTCLLFAQQVGKTGAVHAFEIVPSVANDYLRKTIDANRLTNVIVHNVGLLDKSQSLNLPVSDTMMTSPYAELTVVRSELCNTVCLDQYVSDNQLPFPSLMKIDIEEAEIRCLLGAMELITRCLPLMIIEFHTRTLLEEGYSLLAALGYTLSKPDDTRIDRQMLKTTTRFYGNVFCSPSRAR